MLMPYIDVSETDQELKICAELPGVTENDVDATAPSSALRVPGTVDPDQVQPGLNTEC